MAYSHDSDRTNTPSEHEHIPGQGQSGVEAVSKLAHILDNNNNSHINSSRAERAAFATARSESPQAGIQAYHSGQVHTGSPIIGVRSQSSLSNDGSAQHRGSPDSSNQAATGHHHTDGPAGLRHVRSETAYERSSGHGDDGKAGYALWLPWEESALIDWLFEPGNRRLFNEPRRKKDCHERIIRDVLPSKTSRAIEGKIRTLEKRHQRAEAETRRADFNAKHPGKRPEEVAEALCTNYYKLHAIFAPRPWHKDASSAQRSPSQASATLSVPRSSSPPRLAAAESMPHAQLVRKIAPKRGLHDDDDTPTMLGGKRSRTFPTMALANGRSPAHFLPSKPPALPQRSPLPLRLQQQHQHQHQQQHQQLAVPRLCEPIADVPTRPATATAATMPIPLQHAPQPPTTAPLAGSMRPPPPRDDDTAAAAPREELEWLQLNLRREELAFRKQALDQERILESQRVRLEERRLEMQAREAELEAQRLAVQHKQMDLQAETLKGLSAMLQQTVASLHDVLQDLARPSK